MTKEQRKKLFEALDAFCMREYEEHTAMPRVKK